MNCKVCGKEMKQIPAGISKATGKHYEAFMACPDKCKQPREDVFQGTKPPATIEPQKEDKFVEGKKDNTRFMCKKDLMVACIAKYGDITMPVDNIIDIYHLLLAEIDR